MRATVIHAPGDIRVEDRPEPTIIDPTDAVIRLAATCVCGSDLWPYRGAEPVDEPHPMGHEYLGTVEQVGDAVTSVSPGDFVVGSFVVATGRDPSSVADAIGDADDLLVVALDVTRREDADAAVRAAVDRFGRIDVLVNNAGVSYKGYFEEMTPEQVERQLAVNLVGPMTVTRAVLPVMRAQRSGHVISISSGAGLIGFEFSSVYAAAKAGLEGWMSALHAEVEPFGVATTVVNPGFFRTELISEQSMVYADASIDDYDVRRAAQAAWWEGQAGQQPGDPARLARALLTIADEEPPPRRFIAGADVVALAERKADELRAQADAYRDLSTSMGYDD